MGWDRSAESLPSHGPCGLSAAGQSVPGAPSCCACESCACWRGCAKGPAHVDAPAAALEHVLDEVADLPLGQHRGRELRAAGLCLYLYPPDEIVIGFNASGTTGLPDLVPVEAVARPPRQVLPASARVLLDLLRGDPVLTVRDDEAEECWRIVDPVLSVWRTGVPPLQEYRAGDPPPHGLEAR